MALELSRMVLCFPYLGAHGGNEYWCTLLEKLTFTSVQLPKDADGEARMRENAQCCGWGPSPSILGGSGSC